MFYPGVRFCVFRITNNRHDASQCASCVMRGSAQRRLQPIQIGTIVRDNRGGRQLALRRMARPMPEQAGVLAASKLTLPARP